eukprot:TRINITY_DN17934_c0_g1_i1.p1 TRINITY_DN17934_c0_g1~~TRINITY_DN17934_c0_g1_i1.p1  ORF type:complete len:480 (+),score=94.19 TRINITY_DN17934_c0_g1_i1:159-1442(+)
MAAEYKARADALLAAAEHERRSGSITGATAAAAVRLGQLVQAGMPAKVSEAGSGGSESLRRLLEPLAGVLSGDSGRLARRESGASKGSDTTLPSVPSVRDASRAAQPSVLGQHTPAATPQQAASQMLRQRPWLTAGKQRPAVAAAQGHMLLYAEALQVQREQEAGDGLASGRLVTASCDIRLHGDVIVRKGQRGVVLAPPGSAGSLCSVRFDQREDGSERAIAVPPAQLRAERLTRVVPSEAVQWLPDGPLMKIAENEAESPRFVTQATRLSRMLDPIAECLHVTSEDVRGGTDDCWWTDEPSTSVPLHSSAQSTSRGAPQSSPVIGNASAVRTLCSNAGLSFEVADLAAGLAGRDCDVLRVDRTRQLAIVRCKLDQKTALLPLSCLVSHASVPAATGGRSAEITVLGNPSRADIEFAASSVAARTR